jgi:hypothetical protein
MSWIVQMHGTQPGSERWRLGFTSAVSQEFGFLLKLGFRLVELRDTFARYETARRSVRVFHGRASYELGVEVGRWIKVNGVSYEQAFPLRDIIGLQRDPADLGYGGTSATTADLVRRFLNQLAGWTREFTLPLLTDGDEIFDTLSVSNAARGAAERDVQRASRLRARAQEAWRRRDHVAVVNAYSEIDTELPTVRLSPSERRRLEYAIRALGKSA